MIWYNLAETHLKNYDLEVVVRIAVPDSMLLWHATTLAELRVVLRVGSLGDGTTVLSIVRHLWR